MDAPGPKTPLVIQEADMNDGASKIGNPVLLLYRSAELDGALIEAFNLAVMEDGTYLLFYRSH